MVFLLLLIMMTMMMISIIEVNEGKLLLLLLLLLLLQLTTTTMMMIMTGLLGKMYDIYGQAFIIANENVKILVKLETNPKRRPHVHRHFEMDVASRNNVTSMGNTFFFYHIKHGSRV